MLYLEQKPPRQKSLTSQSKAYCQKYCSILASKASDPRQILSRACVLGDLCLSGQKDNQWWLWATADWLNHSDLHSNWSGTLQTRLQKQSNTCLHSPLCGSAAAEEQGELIKMMWWYRIKPSLPITEETLKPLTPPKGVNTYLQSILCDL